jgi:RND family efflux transporter MFP subunit
MSKGKWFIGLAVLALVGGVVLWRGLWTTDGASARTPRVAAARTVPVETAKAERKDVPVLIQALGTVTPVASVAIKARVDTTITGVHFQDGALVHKGEPLFTLDGRAIEAQIAQTEGQIARDQAQLEGAERDVRRYTDLVAKGATPTVNLDNAKTQSEVFKAAIQADKGTLENLKVQLSYTTITAPITGRISAAAVKIGNFVRQADTTPMATINQMAPVYVSFTVPQKNLPDIRSAIAAKTASVQAVIPGSQKRAEGQVTMIENTVDPTTGMITMRATFDNADQVLWPGALATMRLILRYEEGVVVPNSAVLTGQAGTYVYLVKDNVANVQRVIVARNNENETVISEGLSGGETVVVNGHLLLNNGTKVSPREAKAGS